MWHARQKLSLFGLKLLAAQLAVQLAAHLAAHCFLACGGNRERSFSRTQASRQPRRAFAARRLHCAFFVERCFSSSSTREAQWSPSSSLHHRVAPTPPNGGGKGAQRYEYTSRSDAERGRTERLGGRPKARIPARRPPTAARRTRAHNRGIVVGLGNG